MTCEHPKELRGFLSSTVVSSKHTGHSHTASTLLALKRGERRRLSIAARIALAGDVLLQEPRVVPSGFDDEARESFLAMAARARTEAVNCYTLVSLGLQAHVAHARARREREAQLAPGMKCPPTRASYPR